LFAFDLWIINKNIKKKMEIYISKSFCGNFFLYILKNIFKKKRIETSVVSDNIAG
jgi:hypothetical protein